MELHGITGVHVTVGKTAVFMYGEYTMRFTSLVIQAHAVYMFPNQVEWME